MLFATEEISPLALLRGSFSLLGNLQQGTMLPAGRALGGYKQHTTLSFGLAFRAAEQHGRSCGWERQQQKQRSAPLPNTSEFLEAGCCATGLAEEIPGTPCSPRELGAVPEQLEKHRGWVQEWEAMPRRREKGCGRGSSTSRHSPCLPMQPGECPGWLSKLMFRANAAPSPGGVLFSWRCAGSWCFYCYLHWLPLIHRLDREAKSGRGWEMLTSRADATAQHLCSAQCWHYIH